MLVRTTVASSSHTPAHKIDDAFSSRRTLVHLNDDPGKLIRPLANQLNAAKSAASDSRASGTLRRKIAVNPYGCTGTRVPEKLSGRPCSPNSRSDTPRANL